MNCLKISRLACAIGLLLVASLATPHPASAQTLTTGTLSGVVLDQSGAALPGVTINAVHEPTGTQYTAPTDGEGRFQILNVRVGGPYTVTATLSGFADQKRSGVVVSLGEARGVDFKMGVAGVVESITVTAQTTFSETRAGTASNISREALENLPTIQRGIFDFARTSPYFNVSPDSAGNDSFVSVAGRNNRYNNIQIDGSVNNDVFGIPSSGTPGGQTGSQPISLDAIQEIQLVVAPYDVRQGGFSGGGINAVTKSGSNSLSGSAYWYGRNQSLVGAIPGVVTAANPSPADGKIGKFKDQQGGFSLGGPVVKNRAFFFGNVEFGRKTTPVGFSVSGKSGQAWNHDAEVRQIVSIFKNQYGYDAGNLDEVSTPVDNDKVFARLDFNLSSRNQLTVRTNYVSGVRTNTSSGLPSTIGYVLPAAYYVGKEKVLTPVGQLNTTFAHAFNELRGSYNRQRFARTNPDFPLFPYVRVDLADGTNVRLGTENSSHANQLRQDIVEVTDDLTWVKGRHSITFGTHNEFFHFWNLFIQNLYGNYEFGSVENLQAGFAQFYSHGYSNTADPQQAAEFSVRQFGFYAGDQWRARSNLTLTYGLRVDIPHFPDTPRANPVTVADFGFATDVVPAPKMWSPRIGFNWDLSNGGARRSQVRGGVGLFTGRTPYVWLSNQYGNTGLDYTTITANFLAANRIAFVADPNAQPNTVTGGAAGRQSVNLIDPDYKFPMVVRTNLAYDRDLGFWGLIGTGELLLTKNVKEVAYQNLNYVTSGTLPDSRLVYRKLDANLNDALLLSNTTKGSSWTITAKIDRPFRNGFMLSGSYLYNRARSINDGTASTAGSNWANNPVQFDTNNPPLARSNFDAGNRVNLMAAVPIRLGKGVRSTASFFYNGQDGRPYVILFNGDANGDGRTNNDIAFVPASADQVILLNGTWEQLNAYLANDPASRNYRGQIPPRNAGRAPWSNQLDVRYAVNIPTGSRARVELTMDVLNLLNLLNKEWGWQYFPLFPSSSANGLIRYGGIDAATGKERLDLATINAPTFQGTFQRDDLRSRWQAQWGARVRF